MVVLRQLATIKTHKEPVPASLYDSIVRITDLVFNKLLASELLKVAEIELFEDLLTGC